MKKRLLSGLILFPFFLGAAIYQLQIEGPIDSITEEYIVQSFKKIRSDPGASLIIIQVDTPGGMDTSMRTIIKEILNSPTPVAVYISPRGSRAASAGFYITMASDIAAMAPGTNMGAAHPVSITGTDLESTMKQKVTNDAVSYIKTLAKNRNRNAELAENAVSKSESYTAEECLQKGLSEYIANDVDELLQQLQGKTIRRIDGREIKLQFQERLVTPLTMSNRQKFLKTITNPNLAFFLLIIGLVGLYIEFTHPGVVVPGVLGGISLLLAFLAFQILPINYVGLALILLSVGLLIAEIKVQGFGLLGIGGIASFILGSVILINSPIPEMRPAMTLIITLAICTAAVFLFLTYKVIRSMRKKPQGGKEGLENEMGTARTDIGPSGGKVFIHGEWWNAVADEPIPEGAQVKVVSITNLVLKVKKEGG